MSSYEWGEDIGVVAWDMDRRIRRIEELLGIEDDYKEETV